MPTRLRGTIERIDAKTIVVKPRRTEKSSRSPPLSRTARRRGPLPIDPSAIQEGTFVGTTAVPRPDGSLPSAVEVHVFPEAARGTGEGHRPASSPNSTMTNATDPVY